MRNVMDYIAMVGRLGSSAGNHAAVALAVGLEPRGAPSTPVSLRAEGLSSCQVVKTSGYPIIGFTLVKQTGHKPYPS